MYGKYLPRRARDTHFDIMFDYKGRAQRVRQIQHALDNIFTVGMPMVHAKDSLTAQTKLLKIWRAAIADAYPPGFWEDAEQLRNRDPAGLPIAIEFLEADPWFFRTGYVKEKLIRYLLRFDVSERDAARLRNVVLAAVDQCYRREFREYCRLARKVDAPELRQQLHERLTQGNADIRRRAQWMLDGLEKGVPRYGARHELRLQWKRAFLDQDFLDKLEQVRSGNSALLNWAVLLLTEDGLLGSFGSGGRMRGKLVGALAEVDVPVEFRTPLQKLILSAVDTWYVYAFDRYCKLASRLNDPEFRRAVEAQLDHPDAHVQRRASWVLKVLQ
jgi:hypothetical protein